jgi:hypothetical protein
VQAYPAILPNVNVAELRPVPEPVWTYEQRVRFSERQLKDPDSGQYARLRRKLGKSVERRDAQLAAILTGDVDPKLKGFVLALLAWIRTGSIPGLVGPIPGWVYEARRLLEEALALRPDHRWLVPAPSSDTPPAKPRDRWWVPRRSWTKAWAFLKAMKKTTRYLWALHDHVVRTKLAVKQARRDAEARRESDQSSGHPVPLREPEGTERKAASGIRSEDWRAIAARIERNHGLAVTGNAT